MLGILDHRHLALGAAATPVPSGRVSGAGTGFGTDPVSRARHQVEVSKGLSAFGGEGPGGAKPLSVPQPKNRGHPEATPAACGYARR